MKADKIISLVSSHYAGDHDRFDVVFGQLVADESSSGRSAIAERLVGAQERAKRERARKPLQALPIEDYIAKDGFGSFADVRKPAARLSDLVLAEEVRGCLEQVAAERSKIADLLDHGLAPTMSVLLHGPSGTGKTSCAEAIATEVGLPLVVLKLSEVIDSHMGVTSSHVSRVIRAAKQMPCVLLLDEADALCMARSGSSRGGTESEQARIVASVTTEIDALRRGGCPSILVATTNRIDTMDAAVLRRFDMLLEVGYSTHEALHSYVLRLFEKHGVQVVGKSSDHPMHPCISFAQAESVTMRLIRRAVLENSSKVVEWALVENEMYRVDRTPK